MVWYCMTSILLLFCSIGSRDGCSPGVWSRDTCCAFASIDSRKDNLHDSKYGHLSDYNSSQFLSPGTLTIAFCLFARHQKALEQHSEVPHTLRCSAFNDIENYRLNADLLEQVNPEVLSILKADIGSNTCLAWFRQFWNSGQYTLGNFIKLKSNQERRRNKAFPTDTSCNEAFEEGCLCVEDLLPLSESIFRGTVHGLKQSTFTSRHLQKVSTKLRENFKPSCFQDGSIDIGYVFHAPPGKECGVYLRRQAVLNKSNNNTNILIPVGCSKSLKDMGSYFSSAPGYPVFVGLSTRRGICGAANSGISYLGVRRLKAYHTKWRGDSYRGKTFYDTPSSKKLERILSNYKTLYETILSVQQDGEKVLEDLFSEIREGFDQIKHNLSYRSRCESTFQNTEGFRLEYTCFFDSLFHFLKEPVDILRMQEERANLDQFQLMTIKRTSPDYYPWWMMMEKKETCLRLFPLSLVSNRVLFGFCLSLEAKALQLSMEIFVRGVSIISSSQSNNGGYSKRSDFIEYLLEDMSRIDEAAKLISILATACFRLAYRQVNNMLCNIFSCAPCTTDPWMSVTGISASWWISGYPAIILSRLCRFPCFNVAYELPSKEGTKTVVSQKDGRFLSCIDDYQLPPALTYRNSSMPKDVRKLKIHGHADEQIFNSVLVLVDQLLGSLIRHASLERMKTDVNVLLLGVYIVKELVADIGYTLLSFSNEMSIMEESWFLEKFNGNTEKMTLQKLNSIVEGRMMWADGHRIDHPFCTMPKKTSFEQQLNNLRTAFEIKSRFVVASQDLASTGRFLKLSQDGFVSDKEFINVLIMEASAGQKRTYTSQRRWNSVLAVEATMDVFKHYERGEFLPKFLAILSKSISMNMKAAGFGNICPLFLRKPSGFKKETRSLWGPDLTFAKMRFSFHEENYEVAGILDSENVAYENIAAEIKEIENRLCHLSSARNQTEMNSPEWFRLTKEYLRFSRRFWCIPKHRGTTA